MIAHKPAQPRELLFDHDGHRFKVTANPDGNGYELALWRDDVRIRGLGFVTWDDIDDAEKSGFHDDLVGGAMDTIRDALLTKEVPDPETSESGHGN